MAPMVLRLGLNMLGLCMLGSDNRRDLLRQVRGKDCFDGRPSVSRFRSRAPFDIFTI